MKKVIIVLSVLLFLLVGIFIFVYRNTNIDNNPNSIAVADKSSEIEEIRGSTYNNVTSNITDNTISYTGGNYSGKSLPTAFTEDLKQQLNEDYLNCVYTLISEWVQSFDGDLNTLELLDVHYPSDYEEVTVSVGCSARYAVIHMSNNKSIVGYVEEKADR